MRYNTSTLSFEKCQSIPVAREGFQLVSGPRDTIFVVGGKTLLEHFDSDRLSHVPSTKIHQYNAKFNHWELLRYDSKTTIFDEATSPCFIIMNCLIAIGQFGKISCIDINKNYISKRSVSTERARESLLGKLCSTQVRSIAVITQLRPDSLPDDADVVFVLVDLARVVKQHREQEHTNLPDAEVQSSNADKTVVVPRSEFSFNGNRCYIIALCTCGDKLLVLTRMGDGDIALFNCNADDFVDGTSPQWQFSARQSSKSIGFPVMKVEYAKLFCMKSSLKTANNYDLGLTI